MTNINLFDKQKLKSGEVEIEQISADMDLWEMESTKRLTDKNGADIKPDQETFYGTFIYRVKGGKRGQFKKEFEKLIA